MAKEGLRKRTIEIAAGLPMDASAATTQTFGAIAAKGGGKSYLAGKFAEELFDAGAPFLVIDPIGNWSALTLGRDGKSAGLSVVVIGGERGDVPLDEAPAGEVASLLIAEGVSAVLDVSELSKTKRKGYVADFCEALFRAARKKKAPFMVILEEAQLFAPQHCNKGEERMLGAVTDIVRLGRNHGLGSMLVSQRPQSVSKEVLNQVECLFVGQLRGPQERKAIAGWVQEQGVSSIDVEQLPKLEVGEFLCWSPSWLSTFRKVKVLPKRTFDGSMTPVLGVVHASSRRTDRQGAAEAIAKLLAVGAEDSTPRGISDALDALDALGPDAGASMKALQAVNDKLEAENAEAWERIYRAEDALKELSVVLTEAATTLIDIKWKLVPPRPTGEEMAIERVTRCAVARHHERQAEQVAPSPKLNLGHGAVYGEKALDKADRTILDVLGWQEGAISKRKLALLTGYSAKGGGFNNALGRLRKAGRISGSGDLVITPEGHKLARKMTMPAWGRARFEWWVSHSKVDGCMHEILLALREA